MLPLLPRQLPPLSMMLDDLGRPRAEALASALGVTARTVRRWVADDQAPRCAMLALFWVTRWGQSQVDCEAHNAATLYAAYARSLEAEKRVLEDELSRVLALADVGSANDASQRVKPLTPVLAFRARV